MKFQPIIPFEPIIADRLPAGEQWIAQIKWDGVRMVSYYDGNSTELINRRGNNRTRQYPELADAGLYCKAGSAILDGEVIALSGGKPSFHEVMRRDSLKKDSAIASMVRQIPVLYMVFDIVYCNGEWLLDRPLSERQHLLEEMLLPHPHVQAVPSYSDPEALFSTARANGLEGIVCKELTSLYTPGGKDKRWLKRKIIFDLNAVAGGVTFRDGIVNALLLGLYDADERLHYIGHAGTGRLTVKDWRDLTALARSLAIDDMPFASLPQRVKGAFWIKPELVFKIHFVEWNISGTLRQPSIQARVDVSPGECRLPERLAGV
ncbi:bifunctional non-homologous end joining protein LigD [Paenibacillus sophorae]|uniref:DNA ligase (ATP) n=1 Tax=Paenibacillus sophorae TaxID=1333845 RepID=A0A1H8VL23_9BACL|nr:RNA ligase family protein [Paenibacillus sophorae]QWU17188.1 DNA ligase [Paenibacillus sophorae]SEP16121.1 bifunctional non-homologous end joining protein LigD [Paenibacillus sophorae]